MGILMGVKIPVIYFKCFDSDGLGGVITIKLSCCCGEAYLNCKTLLPKTTKLEKTAAGSSQLERFVMLIF
jgi:hypothetical protein